MPRRRFLTACLGLALAIMLPMGAALADRLDDLRAQGVIGERWDGYVQIRQGGDAEARQVVDQVNAQRRKIYEKRAANQGVTTESVGKVYAQQIVQQAPAGTYFLQPNGQWVQK